MAARDNGRIGGNGVIAASIVLAALIVSWALPSAPRYQLAASGSAIVRMDNDSGEIIACDLQACRQIREPDRAHAHNMATQIISNMRGNMEPKQQQLPAAKK